MSAVPSEYLPYAASETNGEDHISFMNLMLASRKSSRSYLLESPFFVLRQSGKK